MNDKIVAIVVTTVCAVKAYIEREFGHILSTGNPIIL